MIKTSTKTVTKTDPMLEPQDRLVGAVRVGGSGKSLRALTMNVPGLP
jgi:hypothetical protein